MSRCANFGFDNSILLDGLKYIEEEIDVINTTYGIYVGKTSEAIYTLNKTTYPITVIIDGIVCTEVVNTPTSRYQYRLPNIVSANKHAIEFSSAANGAKATVKYYGYGSHATLDMLAEASENLIEYAPYVNKVSDNLNYYTKFYCDDKLIQTKRIRGMILSRNTSTALYISSGLCLCDRVHDITQIDNAMLIGESMTTGMYKDISQQFSEGNIGGMLYPPQTYNNYGYYNIYAILKNNGVTDFAACLDTITFTLPPNYVAKRMIGTLRLSNGIPNFIMYDDRWIKYDTSYHWYSQITSDTEVSTKLVPGNVRTIVDILFNPGVPQLNTTMQYLIRGSNENTPNTVPNYPILRDEQTISICTSTYGTHYSVTNQNNYVVLRVITSNGSIYIKQRGTHTYTGIYYYPKIRLLKYLAL